MRKTAISPDQKVLLDLLVARRRKAGLTQVEVAKKLQKPQSFVSKCENGTRRLDVVEFIELTQALSIDPLSLLRIFLMTR
jgi:transcriptional regulator with XRE-family HTH domain